MSLHRRFGLQKRYLALIAGMAVVPHALGQSSDTAALWEVGVVGAGVRQQAYPGSSQAFGRALALPYFIYRGKYWRADEGNIGLRAFKSDRLELDLGFAGAFGANSGDISARSGMPDLGTLFEFGPKLVWKLGDENRKDGWRAEFALRGVFDLSDKLRDKGIAFEPELIYQGAPINGWRYSASVGAIYGDQRLADTFYGVAPVYAIAGRPAYEAQPGLVLTRLSLNVGRTVTPDVRLFGFARLATLEGTANINSPLTRQNFASTFGAGVVYTFVKSSDRAKP